MKSLEKDQWVMNHIFLVRREPYSKVDKIRTEGNNDLKLTLPCITSRLPNLYHRITNVLIKLKPHTEAKGYIPISAVRT